MYLFFDSEGTLREQITKSPVRIGDTKNRIYVYWDSEYMSGVMNASYCIFEKPDGNNTPMISCTGFVDDTIPYDPNRDLQYFKYSQTYHFCVFDMPDSIFIPSGDDVNSVLFSCWLIYNTSEIKTMSVVAFAIEPSTLSVESDQNINVAQWNILVKKLGNAMDAVSLSTDQTITGQKTFTKDVIIESKKLIIDDAKTGDALIQMSTEDENTGNQATHKIIADGIGDGQTYNIKLPNVNNGRLLTDNADLNMNTGKKIKVTDSQIKLDRSQLSMQEIPDDSVAIEIHTEDEQSGFDVIHNILTDGVDQGTPEYDIYLPNENGRLVTNNTPGYVKTTGNQQIAGNKTFNDSIVMKSDVEMQVEKITLATEDENYNRTEYKFIAGALARENIEVDITLPADSGILARKSEIPTKTSDLTNDSNFLTTTALTPTILTPVECGRLVPNLPGGEESVYIPEGYGTLTVNVIADYEIVASVEDGDITNIDQSTGVISFMSQKETPRVSYHYEPLDQRVGFKFSIGSDYNGIYVFTHSYLTMLVPIYNLTVGQTYKFTGPGLQNAQGSVITMIHNMMRNSDNTLDIWSGNSDYPMIAGRIGTLAKVKLY